VPLVGGTLSTAVTEDALKGGGVQSSRLCTAPAARLPPTLTCGEVCTYSGGNRLAIVMC
jgi:hypothetical protein